MKILGGQYQPTQLYIRAGFSSPAQAPFILICTGDRAVAGYCLRVMSRPDSSETGGLLLEPGAVTSTSPVICLITAIQYSVWSRHFFSVFLTIHNEAHMHLPWQHLKGERILSSTILVFYDWSGILEKLIVTIHTPHINHYHAFLLAHWFSSACYQYQVGHS